jgi:hypothetical protein
MIIDHTKNEIYYKKGTGLIQFEDSEESKCFANTGDLNNYLHKNQTGNFLNKNTFNCIITTGSMYIDPNIPVVAVSGLKICNAFYQSVCKTGVIDETVQLHTTCATNWIGTGGSNGHSLILQLPTTGELILNDIGLTYKAINLSTNNSHMCFKQGATDIIFAGQGCVATVIWDGQCWNGFHF